MSEKRDKKPTEDGTGHPPDRSRWIAAVGYIFFLCFFSLWKAREDQFIKFHARQGFLLFLTECVVIVTVIVLELTIGKLRFLGLVVVGLIQLITGLGALTLSVVGFVKALFGELWHIPLLGEYVDRVPELHGRQS